MASVEDVRSLLRLAIKYRLAGYAFAMTFPLVQLAKDYNGVGPEKFPAWARKVLDGICRDLLPAVFLHDVKFSHSDGSVEQFIAANDDLRANCRKIADTFPWWRLRRYILRHRAEVIYRVCRDFGWTAYVAAYLKQQQEQGAKQ